MPVKPIAYSDEIALTICTRIAQGESLSQICKDDDMPLLRIVSGWLLLEGYNEFARLYYRARQIQACMMADELPQIADETTAQNHYAQKIKVDTRKWLIALYNTHTDEKPLPKKSWNMTALNEEELKQIIYLAEKATPVV